MILYSDFSDFDGIQGSYVWFWQLALPLPVLILLMLSWRHYGKKILGSMGRSKLQTPHGC